MVDLSFRRDHPAAQTRRPLVLLVETEDLGLERGGTAVAGISDSVTVEIGLVRVWGRRTVVGAVADRVEVAISRDAAIGRETPDAKFVEEHVLLVRPDGDAPRGQGVDLVEGVDSPVEGLLLALLPEARPDPCFDVGRLHANPEPAPCLLLWLESRVGEAFENVLSTLQDAILPVVGQDLIEPTRGDVGIDEKRVLFLIWLFRLFLGKPEPPGPFVVLPRERARRPKLRGPLLLDAPEGHRPIIEPVGLEPVGPLDRIDTFLVRIDRFDEHRRTGGAQTPALERATPDAAVVVRHRQGHGEGARA